MEKNDNSNTGCVCKKKFTWAVAFLLIIIFFNLHIKVSMIDSLLPYIGHVDEPAITQTAKTILTTNNWNPNFFKYPSLPIYVTTAAIAMGYLHAASNVEVKNIHEIGSVTFPAYTHPRIIRPAKILLAGLSIICMIFLSFTAFRLISRNGSLFVLIPFILSLSERFLYYSVQYINVDMYACFFVLSVYMFHSSRFKRNSLFDKAFVPGALSGMAIASKYSMLPILVPSLLLIMFFASEKAWKCFVLLCTATLTFIIVVPFSILDVSTFMTHVGAEISHYQRGHFGYEGQPGFSQCVYYLSSVINDFGSWSWLFVVAGMWVIIRKDWRLFVVTLSFPSLLLLCLSLQKVHFLRNALSLFAFYALLGGIGILHSSMFAFHLLDRCICKSKLKNYKTVVVLFLMAIIIGTFFPVSRFVLWMNVQPDTRKVAVEWMLNNIPVESGVFIPTEMPMDTRLIDGQFRIVRESLIDCHTTTFKSLLSEKGISYVLMPKFDYDKRKPSGKMAAERLNELLGVLTVVETFSAKELFSQEKDIFSGRGVLVNYFTSVSGRDPEFFIGQYKNSSN
jgi:hypothetical protein